MTLCVCVNETNGARSRRCDAVMFDPVAAAPAPPRVTLSPRGESDTHQQSERTFTKWPPAKQTAYDAGNVEWCAHLKSSSPEKCSAMLPSASSRCGSPALCAWTQRRADLCALPVHLLSSRRFFLLMVSAGVINNGVDQGLIPPLSRLFSIICLNNRKARPGNGPGRRDSA